MWIRSESLRPGRFSSLPFGAPVPTNTASNPPSSSSFSMLATGVPEPQVRAHADDVADLLVEHFGWQAECRNIRAHQAAGDRVLLEDHDFVADRQQVVRDRERRRARADAGDALAVLSRGRLRQPRRDVVAQVRGDPLEPANRDRLVLDAPAPAGGFARPVADTAEDAGEDIGFAVDDVGVGIASLRDQPDVLGNIGVRGTRPLAVHHLVVIVRIGRVRRLHQPSSIPAGRATEAGSPPFERPRFTSSTMRVAVSSARSPSSPETTGRPPR